MENKLLCLASHYTKTVLNFVCLLKDSCLGFPFSRPQKLDMNTIVFMKITQIGEYFKLFAMDPKNQLSLLLFYITFMYNDKRDGPSHI